MYIVGTTISFTYRLITFEQEFWHKLGSLGLIGIETKSDYGGAEGSYLDTVVVMEELSRASGAIGLSYLAHNTLCLNQISRHGTHEQKLKYLPKVGA